MLDRNGNGTSDIWEALYSTPACGLQLSSSLDIDSDGDGVLNRQEAVAGTDPRDARSVPRIRGLELTTHGVVVTIAGALGKSYQLLGSELDERG
ncbi:MAG TPA: hypothetical protein VNU68_21640 [Verrucomicrobiae bacterium]|nr:hypothetical protein [Verrucomicrobiae bacterium]